MKTLQLAIMAIAGIMAIGIASFAVIYNTTQETAASQKYQYVIHESYDGIDKNFGTVTIQNKPYHVTNLNENIQGSTNPTWIEMYGVNFSFPNGIKLVNTPGGSFFESYVTFPDDSLPYRMAGSLSSLPGSPRYDFTTVLSTILIHKLGLQFIKTRFNSS